MGQAVGTAAERPAARAAEQPAGLLPLTRTARPATRERWRLAAVAATAVALLATSLYLILRIGMTGDEPWYVLQGYSLTHYHTVDMAKAIHDRPVYVSLLATLPPDHVADYRGDGTAVLPYLPGYAAFVGPLYALGGRFLIVVAQALLATGTATLLLREALRLWRSRAAAIVALAAYLTSLPALLYVGEVFPSTLAAGVALASYVLVARALPRATCWRLTATAGAVGLLAGLAPWLHVRYLSLALCIVAGALIQLALRIRRERAAGEGTGTNRRAYALAAALPCTCLALSFGLIALYSRRYFGTWYPQYHTLGEAAFAGFDPTRVARLLAEVFLDRTSGLLPWMPLALLVPLGWALLVQSARREALLLLLWMAGLLGAFASAAVAPYVGQAYALPARFTVECQPFFALGAAAVFAAGWPALRRWWRSHGRAVQWRAALAVVCLALVLVDAWFVLVALRAPWLLYPVGDGPRLVAAYPHLLPAWWFDLFGNWAP